jgi:hypothetical protein
MSGVFSVFGTSGVLVKLELGQSFMSLEAEDRAKHARSEMRF